MMRTNCTTRSPPAGMPQSLTRSAERVNTADEAFERPEERVTIADFEDDSFLLLPEPGSATIFKAAGDAVSPQSPQHYQAKATKIKSQYTTPISFMFYLGTFIPGSTIMR